MSSCMNKQTPKMESREAKALLQGTWQDIETEDVMFTMLGDTVYYADSTSLPARFWVVDDTLYMGNRAGYLIEKHTAHILWFRNQSGELVKLEKVVADDGDELPKEQLLQPKTTIQTLTEVLKRDTVVFKDGKRYHCYIAINPTRYKVIHQTVNEDGLSVDEVYYDNIIHISVFQGTAQLFSRDMHKSDYAKQVDGSILEKAILNDMNFLKVDDAGFHFVASLCMPNGASCYLVENIINEKGAIHLRLAE